MSIPRLLFLIIMLPALLGGCGTNNSQIAEMPSTDWNYYFVIWNNQMYVIKTREKDIEQVNQVEEQIGTITHYSDVEGEAKYSSNFSNYFEEGTKLYKIKNIDTSEAIAIQSGDGTFIKAIKQQ